MISERQKVDLEYTEKKSQPSRIKAINHWKAQDISPNILKYILHKYGVSQWMSGLFQICNPDDFETSLEQTLEDHKYIRPEKTVPFGLTAFGQLHAWNVDIGVVVFDYPRGNIMTTEDPRKSNNNLSENMIMLSIPTSKSSYDDFNLFEKAHESHGPLVENYIYGFFPPLKIKNNPAVADIKIIDAISYFKFMRDLDRMSTYFVDVDGSSGNNFMKID